MSDQDRLVVEVTSTHSWFRPMATSLRFTDANNSLDGRYVRITRDNKKQLLFEWFPTRDAKEPDIISDPERPDMFMQHLAWAFMLTGLGPWEMHVLSKGQDVKQVYNLFYQAPLPSWLRLVQVSTCGCNMGECSAPTSVKLVPPANVKTTRDAFALFGYLRTEKADVAADSKQSPWHFYEHPDSVVLDLARFKAPSELGCHTKTPFKLESPVEKDHVEYFQFGFSR